MAYVYPTCVSVVLYKGGRVRIHPDQRWHDDDPFVKARPELFSADPNDVAHSDGHEPVEQATKAPGEKRPTRRARPKAGGTGGGSS